MCHRGKSSRVSQCSAAVRRFPEGHTQSGKRCTLCLIPFIFVLRAELSEPTRIDGEPKRFSTCTNTVSEKTRTVSQCYARHRLVHDTLYSSLSKRFEAFNTHPELCRRVQLQHVTIIVDSSPPSRMNGTHEAGGHLRSRSVALPKAPGRNVGCNNNCLLIPCFKIEGHR